MVWPEKLDKKLAHSHSPAYKKHVNQTKHGSKPVFLIIFIFAEV
jgi:hypothetical protein